MQAMPQSAEVKVTLIDAIKSGRPFRRGVHGWIDPKHDTLPTHLMKADILADDWETKDVEVTITRAQFWEAVNAIGHYGRWNGDDISSAMKAFARKLGLEEEK